MPLINAPKAEIDRIDNILAESGYVEPVNNGDPTKDAKNYLSKVGAGLTDCLDNMVSIMRFAEAENVKLKATENCLAIHGVSFKDDKNITPATINIQINNVSDANQGRIDEVLCPIR